VTLPASDIEVGWMIFTVGGWQRIAYVHKNEAAGTVFYKTYSGEPRELFWDDPVAVLNEGRWDE